VSTVRGDPGRIVDDLRVVCDAADAMLSQDKVAG
jgi:hypothetical protein